jgi:hypothetical protein
MPSNSAFNGSLDFFSSARRTRVTGVNSSGNAPVSKRISWGLPSRINPIFTESPAFLKRIARLSSSADFTFLPSTLVIISANSRSDFSAGPPGINCLTTTPSSTPTAKSRSSTSSRRVVILTPNQARVTFPSFINISDIRFAKLIGTAKPIPVFIPRIKVLIPITSP